MLSPWFRLSSRVPVALSLALTLACSPALPPRSPGAEPLMDDPDRQPFTGRPAMYYTSQVADGVDKTVLRPLARLFAFEASREAININTLDEVADSSWFENRIGTGSWDPEDVARGPCDKPPPPAPWRVLSAKGKGAAPGFVIEAADGQRHLIKFDSSRQGPRASAADTIAARLFHAVGFFVPCNRVVEFDRARLQVDTNARRNNWLGQERPLRVSEVDALLARQPTFRGGRYRALASQWLSGVPLGPWRFEGTRGDDPNDIVPHQHRRELRGLRLLAAWVAHKDQRAENTLSLWMEVEPDVGWVRHALLDFGDSFGHYTPPANLARRLAGHAHGFDLGQVSADLFTWGILRRPFEAERFGPSGPVFGFYNAERFDPEAWRAVFPNPAFDHMTERDGAWMARIIAAFGESHLEAAVAEGLGAHPTLARELLRILRARQLSILRRYLVRLSPLHRARVERAGDREELCFDDLAVLAGVAAPVARRASLRGVGAGWASAAVRAAGPTVCVSLSPAQSSSRRCAGLVQVKLEVGRGQAAEGRRVLVGLYRDRPGASPRVVSLERFEAKRQHW